MNATREQLEDRYDEIMDEFDGLEDALDFVDMVEYLWREGFITIEEGRFYIEGEACTLPELPVKL